MTNEQLLNEFSDIAFRDKRFHNNFNEMVSDFYDGIGLSFSRALGDRLRKSAWRLLSGDELDLQSSHRAAAYKRCEGLGIVLAIEDTTELNYTVHKKSKLGLGILGGGGNSRVSYGLSMHSSLLTDENGIPLGLAFQKTWAPSDQYRGMLRNTIPLKDKESYKWVASLKELNVLAQTQSALKIVKIGDRESDFYELFAQKRASNVELLTRASVKNRLIIYNDKKQHLNTVLSQLEHIAQGTIKITRTKDIEERIATVVFSATSIKMPPSNYVWKGDIIDLNVVHVKEIGERADLVEWILLTTLPISTIEDIKIVAKYYANRWVIERYHYILKQVMRIEQIQIDDLIRLSNVLQIYAVIAWYVLLLYRLGRTQNSEPALDFFDGQSIEILELSGKIKIKTASDVVLAIAALVGFKPTKQQPHPGEKTLGQGLIRFFALKEGFNIAAKRYGTG